jgi:hypothetical protein
MLMAKARSSGFQMSAMTPAPTVWPDALALPDNRRKAIKEAMFGLRAHAAVRGMLSANVRRRMARLPKSSEKVAHHSGKMEEAAR